MKVTPFILEQAIPFINDVSDKVDRAFNVVTCIPVIGGLGALGRFQWGKVQMITGIAVAAISALGVAASKDEQAKSQFKKIAVFGSEYAIHGALNTLKSIGEIFLSLATYTLGNPLLLFLRMPDQFAPAFKYGEFSSSYASEKQWKYA